MDYPFEELQKRFLGLPDSLRQALSSTEVTTEIQEIASDHNLMIDQEETLYQLIACVMLGIISVHDFKDKLTHDLKMNEVEAVALINEVDTKIFSKFKQELLELTNKSDHESLKEEGITITSTNNPEHIVNSITMHTVDNLPTVPTSITPKSMNLAGNNFVNAFLTKPVSTTQTTTAITVGGVGGQPKQAGTGTAGLSPLSAPASMQSSLNSVTTPSNTNQKPIVAPKTYTVDPYKEPLN